MSTCSGLYKKGCNHWEARTISVSTGTSHSAPKSIKPDKNPDGRMWTPGDFTKFGYCAVFIIVTSCLQTNRALVADVKL